MKRSSWRFLWKSEDIRNKLLITLLLLAIYRLAANIPVPGIDRATVAALTTLRGTQGNLINLLDMLSGGAVSNFSILAMGVYPYITAQIILQLLQPIIPALEKKMQDDPREGRIWMEKWTVILTIPMALLSAFGQINIFNQMLGSSIITNWGFTAAKLLPTLTAIFAMVAGTMFGVWIGQLISEFGLRNQGLSLIIFSGIVSRLPKSLIQMITKKEAWWMVFIVVIILVVTIFAIVYIQQGRRNVPVMFPGRRIGNRMSMPVRSNLPLMVNMAGMIPIIFAQSFLTFPAILASFFLKSKAAWLAKSANWVTGAFGAEAAWYPVMFFVLVVLFTYFYTDVMFTQQNYGENLKKQGAQIPGVVRGKPTQDYLTRVQRRITLPGAFFLGFVAVMPYLFSAVVPAGSSATLLLSSSGLLIVVGTVRETVQLIETELRMHGYDDRLINS
ncbi:MAG TPA: preprotein translocase subunit SecY [Anaerolineaceae bacterium]|jgi:preprotein translocase subunit SecY|nr:preprotein translocase subunit SecY [Anaerolineales bacterium]HOG59328.1 preprotein translocase subunit SecY [Anaerolineaceae bacterium]HOR84362.1 preprotein translocase subunit SecY [Anaerolineaceae bacterium]HPL43323.1 preprotein translocase subunit SecY [Anaerolineaceae bacterium]HPY32496.1 preprotein translocase subunit SecY [Anaerolineaceae bacterium]